jgi:dTDP-4-dehydrorhamnose 3,5-epimerase-like enzyme
MQPNGELAQIVSGEAFRHLAYLEFAENATIPRGNHYHNIKEEHLYVVKGTLRASFKNIDSGESLESILEEGSLVTVPPRWAHAYQPLMYSQAIEFANQPFDPADTHKYLIVTG